MTKAKTLDRLELTRKKFSLSQKKHSEHAQQEQQEEHGLQVCPNCGSKALRLDGGCMSCLSCGWPACHNSQEVKLMGELVFGVFIVLSIVIEAFHAPISDLIFALADWIRSKSERR